MATTITSIVYEIIFEELENHPDKVHKTEEGRFRLVKYSS